MFRASIVFLVLLQLSFLVIGQVYPGCDEPGALYVPCTSNSTCGISGCYAKYYPPNQFNVCIQGTGYCKPSSSNPQGLNKFCALQSSGQLEGWFQVECG